MSIKKFKTSSINSFSKKNNSVIDAPSYTYTTQTFTGGSAFTSETTRPTNITGRDTLATNVEWSGSNQGTYFGGSQTSSAGGWGAWSVTLNNGNPLPAGTYEISTAVQLDLSPSPASHDGMYIYAIGTNKQRIASLTNPPHPVNTQFTRTGVFTIMHDQVVKIVYAVADGSSAYSMGGRTYSLTVTKKNYTLATNDCVGYYDAYYSSSYLGSGSTWYDLSANVNNATMQNSGSISHNANGWFNTGSNGYFTATASPFGTTDPRYTFIFVGRLSTWADGRGMITVSDNFTTNQTNAFRTYSTIGGFTNYWWSNDMAYDGTGNLGNVQNNKFFVAAAQFDNTTQKMIINDVLVTSRSNPTGHAASNTNVLIGKTVSAEYFNGDIGAAMIFNRALTSAEMTGIYNFFKERYGI